MNARQAAFYRQACSDWHVFRQFRAKRSRSEMLYRLCGVVGIRTSTFPACHELHYLQMSTEKLSKAYYTSELGTGHAAFRRLLTDLPSNPRALGPLGFNHLADLTRWAGSVKPIVDAVEDLAPAIADRQGLPNPEYPWPRRNPTVAPVDYAFAAELYSHLSNQALSGEPLFVTVFDKMVRTMQSAAWHL